MHGLSYLCSELKGVIVRRWRFYLSAWPVEPIIMGCDVGSTVAKLRSVTVQHVHVTIVAI